jgi:hypothetical protein
MKTIAITIIAAFSLSGCGTFWQKKEPEVLVNNQYVVRTAPDQLKTLPPLPAALKNPKTASNEQVAKWISDNEEYITNLESMIQTLVNFYEKPVSTAEAGTMQPVTPRSAATPDANRVIKPQTAASAPK